MFTNIKSVLRVYDLANSRFFLGETNIFHSQGPVARSLVSANRWLRSIKMYRFPWYLTLVSTNHASSNPGQIGREWLIALPGVNDVFVSATLLV